MSPPSSEDFAEVLRRAIQERGLTLARIRARLAASGTTVSVATLSHWQSGRSLPGRRISAETLVTLDIVLGLEVGTLADAVRSTERRRRAAQDERHSVTDIAYHGEEVMDIYARLGLDWEDGFTRLTVHDRVWLDERGARERQASTLTLRAERDGVDRFSVFQVDVGGLLPLGTFQALSGCHRGRTVLDETNRISFAEFLLPAPLARGDVAAVSHSQVHSPGGDAATTHGRIHRTSFRDFALEVRFHPAMMASVAEQFYEPADSPRITSPDIHIVADTYGRRPIVGGVAQAYISQRGPGISGLRWRWDEAG